MQIIKKIKSIPKHIIEIIQDLYLNFKNFSKESVEKSKNLVETNYNLGLYHLEQGNLFDAKLRFNIIHIIFGPYKDSQYLLARAYMYSAQFKEAKELLKKIADSNNLAKFRLDLIDKKPITSIPTKIIEEDFDSFAASHDEYCSDLGYKASESIVNEILNLIEHLDLKNTTLLEIGCATGYCGVLIRKFFSSNVVDAIDISKNMVKIAKERVDEESTKCIYNNVFQADFMEYSGYKRIYDVVYASCSLHYSNDIAKSLKVIKKILAPSGYLVFIVETSDGNDHFNYQNCNFIYSKKEIEDIAKKAGYSEITIKTCEIQNDIQGIACILKN